MIVAALAVALASLPGLGLTVAILMLTMGTLGMGNGAVFQVVPQRFPDRKSTRLNSSHIQKSRMPSSA